MRIETIVDANFASIMDSFEIESYIDGVLRIKNVSEDTLEDLDIFFSEYNIGYEVIKTSETKYLVIAK